MVGAQVDEAIVNSELPEGLEKGIGGSIPVVVSSEGLHGSELSIKLTSWKSLDFTLRCLIVRLFHHLEIERPGLRRDKVGIYVHLCRLPRSEPGSLNDTGRVVPDSTPEVTESMKYQLGYSASGPFRMPGKFPGSISLHSHCFIGVYSLYAALKYFNLKAKVILSSQVSLFSRCKSNEISP